MKKIALIFLVFIPFLVNAQNTMYFMEQLPQNSKFNPSFKPEMRFYLELPGISGNSFDAYNSGFTYNELDHFLNNLDDPNYDPDNFINSIGDYNTVISEFTTNILTMGFKLSEKDFLSIGMDFNNSLTVDADSEIAFLLAENDNISIENFPIEIDDISVQTNNYFSLGLTYSREIFDGFTIGVHPKVNLNMFGLKTENIYLATTATPNGVGYDYDVQIEGDVYASLPVPLNPEEVGTTDVDFDNLLQDGWEDDISYSDIWDNKSVSVDIGANYELNKWTFAGSLLNLGSSKWNNNAYKLSGNQDNMTITEIDGLDFAIPTKMWLSAKYQLSEKWSAGVAYNSIDYKTLKQNSTIVSLNGQIGKVLTTSFSYTTGYNNDDLGLGFRLRFFPGVDFYFVTDNIIKAIDYKKVNRLSAAFGINFAIWNKKDKPAEDFSIEEDIILQ